MNLKTFQEWSQDQSTIVADPFDIDVSEFTDQVCEEMTVCIARRIKNDQKVMKPAADLGNFSGKATSWSNAKQDLLSYLNQWYGEHNVPLAYVIRDKDDCPEHITSKL